MPGGAIEQKEPLRFIVLFPHFQLKCRKYYFKYLNTSKNRTLSSAHTTLQDKAMDRALQQLHIARKTSKLRITVLHMDNVL